ncbi:MAG: M48 family metallopeptidase [Thermoleophilia bacterium]|nr:M48 family metallopeptidase [Thermoleophilia bacterium]
MPPLRPQSKPDREQRVVALLHPALPEVELTIRRGARTRHVRLHVDETGIVTVSAPRRASSVQLDRIVQERADWLVDTLARFQQTRQATEIDLDRGDPVRYRGSWLPATVVRRGERTRPSVTHSGEQIEIVVATDGDPYAALHRFYRDEARRIVGERVDFWAIDFGLKTGNLSIRDQRTRWGSCTSRGDLSFNWRLVLAPAWVLDAIVVHELCHIDELNHGSRFWTLLDERYPRHVEASEWLKSHGPALRITATQAPAQLPDGIQPVKPRRGRKLTGGQSSLF